MIAKHYRFLSAKGRRLFLGVSGSVAAYKSVELLRAFTDVGVQVDVTLTQGARQFVTPLLFRSLGASVYDEMFTPKENVFEHLLPGQNADAMLVCPATANILAKITHGLADDMLSCQALAFQGTVLVAPAMNGRMWQAKATQDNIALLQKRGVVCISPASGEMACGESGCGRLAELDTIFLWTLKALIPQDLAGKKILLTLGPTREYFDSVRFWSNPSTGQMGASLAVAAWLRGAEVTAVCGPGTVSLPAGITVKNVVSAQQMFSVCHELWQQMDIGCFTAAVADFAPVPYGEGKFKKETAAGETVFAFQTTQDILYSIGKQKGTKKLIGFAAESADMLQENARKKLERKNLDLIVGNPIDKTGVGFGSMENQVWLLDKNGSSQMLPKMAKTELAWKIWDALCTM